MADGQLELPFDVKATASSVDTSQIERALENALSDTSKFEAGLRASISNAFQSINVKAGWLDGMFNVDDSSIQTALSNIISSGDKTGKTFIDIDNTVQQLSQDISHVVSTMTELAQSEEGVNGEHFRSAEEALHEYLTQLQEVLGTQERFSLPNIEQTAVKPEQPPVEAQEIDPAVEKIIELESVLGEATSKIQDFSNAWTVMKDNLHLTSESTQAISSESLELATQRASRLREVFGLWNGTFLGVKSNLGAVTSGVSKAVGSFSNLGKVAGSAMSKINGAVKKGIGHITQFGKQTAKSMDQAGNKMKRMTLQMIKAMLGVRGLYMLFRKMKSAFTESFKGMAEQVPEIQAQFGAFKASLAQIKGSLATAFQPIVSYVLPVLTSLLSVINSVLVAIAKFNAVLTGQGYIYEYTQNQEDYAKSLEGTGKAAKKATKDLMGFDEINRLSDKDSGGGAGGGAGQYVPTAIDPTDAISEFAEKVKEAWKNKDFTEVGQIIGEKLKGVFTSATKVLDMEGQQWARDLSKSLSTLINGIVDVDGLGESFGTALGSALNVGITFLRNFWRDTNFTGIGEQVAGAINGLFEKVNWTGLGEYFGFKFNGIFDFINGIATNTKWTEIATDLSEAINTCLNTMDLGKATTSLSNLLNGLLTSAVVLISTTDWAKIGEQLANGLAGIDFVGILGKAGTLISKGAKGILEMIISFVKKTNWAQTTTDIINGIGEMFSNVWDDGTLVQKLAEGFGALLGAALVALWNIGSWITDNVIAPLGEALSNNFSFDPDSPWYEVGWNIIQGILKGIWDALIGIGKWIADNIVAPMVDGVCAAFGIASPSTVFMDIGLDLIAGLFEGLKGIWDAVKGLFEDLAEKIGGVFEGIKTTIGNIWSSITEGVHTAWNGIRDWLVEKVKNIKTNVSGFFNAIKDGVLGSFRSIRDAGELIWNGLWNIIKSVINTIIGGINGMIWAVESAINFVIDCLNTLSWDVPSWVPGIGGETFGFDIGHVEFGRIPELAQGAVLPPNQPFMAVVGDQTHGTNVEAPLDTIKQAVAEVLYEQLEGMMAGFEAVVQAIQEKDTTAVISYRAIGEANNRYNNEMNRMRGYT